MFAFIAFGFSTSVCFMAYLDPYLLNSQEIDQLRTALEKELFKIEVLYCYIIVIEKTLVLY